MVELKLAAKKYYWTKHALEKIRYYNLPQSRVKRVFRHPQRVETGVAENTLAAMQAAGSRGHPYEIWIMYQIKKEVVKIISAWRYPGKTKPGDRVPVPDEILEELGIGSSNY
ncbi:hypothetical protein CO134_01220 [Candidatus Kuenenbacteria bacterium CG_4_9_14_3_um_filter_39_14]|uniref:DUF4258 domain-containing protein n=6 Tax=Candidatus Kueneniibacteriota TaxID=1752740 RepID=A0A2M7IMG2_9BACT|nr:hypothetical protein [Candidatus Kuenenbacteria bacterium]OIP55867.1 MAG: hypothetical protein AUK13_02115 [Candidatus Kuenenbacteria bacterium CG2_30_39_24]PIP28683.1 MAG: hypothetical protein COX28_03400 [Candidatus Kuenenbacteria bacterium CG23_combo_of_CG06-09_8_20_14_all_39_39]PIR80739.1 MAG: hypothetical protein COU24_02335 [Candidatus Kuenenbacteria bacterium CG10_big_fil_rev_8_21_14_0_10_39_14]PIW95958.1 MAG: hypothetical protein COZ84_00670 [Candidatus Kuenenbacteria bacterium CG_4_